MVALPIFATMTTTANSQQPQPERQADMKKLMQELIATRKTAKKVKRVLLTQHTDSKHAWSLVKMLASDMAEASDRVSHHLRAPEVGSLEAAYEVIDDLKTLCDQCITEFAII